jgi:hypothetical protein
MVRYDTRVGLRREPFTLEKSPSHAAIPEYSLAPAVSYMGSRLHKISNRASAQ